MRLDALTLELDELFSIQDWERDPAMSRFLPRVYEGLGFDYTQLLERDFCARFNGLMLRGAETVDHVYCAAFPCAGVVEEVLDKGSGGALLFLHHPIDMEVAGRGFLPIPPPTLEQMRALGISIYACHAPMDCHDEMGTTTSIAQAFEVEGEQGFAPYGNGFAGRIGAVTPQSLTRLVASGKEIFGVERVEVGGAEPASIAHVAIVAGGGDDVEVMEEAETLGADAYITGEWYTRTMPPKVAEREWAEGNRAACEGYAASSSMAMLGFSHAATEFLVMETRMAPWFRDRGLAVDCLEQSDWWR